MDILSAHLPEGSLTTSSSSFPGSLPDCLCLYVTGPGSVPVEAAMLADNTNYLPAITGNCRTARNGADTLGGT